MQSALQHVGRNLPALIRDPIMAILGQVSPEQGLLQLHTHTSPPPILQECYVTLIYNADFSSTYCIKLAISKGLGLGIVVFGSIMKVPQILKIVRGRSARGISLAMYALEVVAYTISLAYAYRQKLPFSTYGENASLTLQSECEGLVRTSCQSVVPC